MKHKNNLLVLIAACLMLGACNEAKTGTAAPATSTTTAATSEVTTTTAETTTAGTTTTTTAEKEEVDNVVEPEQIEYTADGIECDPIDKSLDCEQLMLDKADKLHEMISGWCNIDKKALAFEVGDQCESFQGWDGVYKVVSDTVKTYEDFKALYENDIYGAYIDALTCEYLIDIGGELYYIKPMSGLLGTYETWYMGCDVTDDAIVGHFAILCWGDEDDETQNANFLNDTSNYRFYDIKVQNVGGKYVITSCGDENDITLGSVFDHGLFYNSGIANRTLITNEAVKPKN